MRVLVEVHGRRLVIENVTTLRLDDAGLVRIEHIEGGELFWRLFAPDQARIEILP